MLSMISYLLPFSVSFSCYMVSKLFLGNNRKARHILIITNSSINNIVFEVLTHFSMSDIVWTNPFCGTYVLKRKD